MFLSLEASSRPGFGLFDPGEMAPDTTSPAYRDKPIAGGTKDVAYEGASESRHAKHWKLKNKILTAPTGIS